MLRCKNCNGPVDENAVACPRCGRPKAGEEAANIQTGGCLVVVLIVIGLIVYGIIGDYLDGGSSKHKQPTSSQTTRSETYEEATTEQDPQPPDLHNYPDQYTQASLTTQHEVADISDSGTKTTEFAFSATVVDSRGEVVLQSGPKMRSKNVTTLSSGTSVLAATKDGNWIQVKTPDGAIGYLRKRQLSFD